MSCSGTSDCLCGCCCGANVQTPAAETNLPGLPAVSYRAGTWASFKTSMLARLSSTDYPALSSLRTRNDDDFTIAFLDATAMVLDILTFYQERLVNESYLGTATQLRSMTELSRLISYAPTPGVSASVYLAFTLKAALGQPPASPSAAPITIPQGTQVQSVPAQGQKAQIFETSADIKAKPDWNALPVLTGQPLDWNTLAARTAPINLCLQGTSTQLNPGDALVILGIEREKWSGAGNPPPQWNIVVVNQVEPDAVAGVTYVTCGSPLNPARTPAPAWTSAKVFVFRQKAAIFGNNAPDANLFVNPNSLNTSPLAPTTSLPNLITDWEWKGFPLGNSQQIDLDSVYSKIVPGSWFALVGPSGAVQLYKVTGASSISATSFGLSGKVTELVADWTDFSKFDRRKTSVLAQSEQLTVAPQTLTYPLYGNNLDLADLRPDLAGVQVVAVSGNRQKLAVAPTVTGLTFRPKDGSGSLPLNPGDMVTLTGPANLPQQNGTITVADWTTTASPVLIEVEDASGRQGTINAAVTAFTLAPSSASDPIVTEYALVQVSVPVTTPAASVYPHTQLQLVNPLCHCYDRATATVNANAGLATNGASVTEILGGGSASTPNQSFILKQSPLTFVQSTTAQGGLQSTLQVRVTSVTWAEVPSLFNQSSSSLVFATLNQANQTTEVIFGDGVEGALLPTGQSNVQANYRIGAGSAGNVGPGTITTLMDRPLGVSGVSNPRCATGGQDAQDVDDIRSNAPQTVLTLGRAVSITDYQNLAGTYAGIAQACAIWISAGPGQGVFVTVAGVNGAAVPDGSPTQQGLLTRLRSLGNPEVPITIQSFKSSPFTFSASVKYNPSYSQPAAEAQAFQAVTNAFGFAARTFGQCVTMDQIAAVIQNVPGVVAVNVTNLQRSNSGATGNSIAPLGASLPIANPLSPPNPAEILFLDPTATADGLFQLMT